MSMNSEDRAVVPTISTRQTLIETAIRVFSANGFHRTSLDLIALEAGVSKMTIFYHFKNKEELVIAALQHAHDRSMIRIREIALESSSDAKSYISAVFGALEELAKGGKLSNLYVRACAEYTEEDSAIRQTIATQVRAVEMRFSSLATEAGFENPHEVVLQLMHILRGVYASQICPGAGLNAMVAKKMADCVIRVSPAFAA